MASAMSASGLLAAQLRKPSRASLSSDDLLSASGDVGRTSELLPGGSSASAAALAAVGSNPTSRPLFDDPRAGRTDEKPSTFAMIDLWRVYLQQCPDCGHVHGTGSESLSGRPERHKYEYTGQAPRDLLCALCGEVFQSPALTPCGHHFCSMCIRMLLSRTAGRAACPLDGQALTRFALRPAEQDVLERLENLKVRCPVCREEVRKGDLHLHLQDPVRMVEEPRAYEEILRPFYLSCPLSKFTVGELNGSSSLIRFYRQLGEASLRRFVLTTEEFIVLPDPKMGFQPHSEDDFRSIRDSGGYFNAYWVHPSFRGETWWHTEGQNVCGQELHTEERLLSGHDCSAEPWHASSFVHTWSTVRKPVQPRYLCCLRDLRGEDLPILEAFQRDVLCFLRENYDAREDSTWIFAHYPSSARYSTLHFHIIFGGIGSRYEKYAKKLERPHQLSRQFSLQEIIESLRQDPRHFERQTLTYYLGDKADLMDPISAFFGVSPHRYLQDFTFHWDPEAVALAAPPVEATNLGSELPAGRQAKTGDLHERPGYSCPDPITQQLGDLRLAVEGLRRAMDELRDSVSDVARGQRAEEAGAARLALLQVGELAKPAGREARLHGFLWLGLGALVGGLMAVTAGRLRGGS